MKKITIICSLLIFGSIACNANAPVEKGISSTETITPTENILIATFEDASFGDYFHLIFKDDKGKEWDFGSGDNNYGDFSFTILDDNAEGGESANLDLVGKKFKITWENKIVKSYDETGENVIEIEAMSIVKIELLK